MHNTVKNLLDIQNNIKTHLNKINVINEPKVIAVSKTFKIDKILPLIEYGHTDYGENKVQEAVEKWSAIKNSHEHLKLHMIGKLQTNKVKYVIPLFDYIHSLDNIKLAEKIAEVQLKENKSLKIFIQVNIGKELQKAGIDVSDLQNFYKICSQELRLNIIGLMCIPPKNGLVKNYFNEMQELKKTLNIENLSMGMSEDYLDAIACGSTYVRIGSKIFGERS